MRFYPQDHLSNTPEFVCSPDRFSPDRLGNWLSTIVQSSLDAVIVIDSVHQIVLANREAGRLFGHLPTQMLSRALDLLIPARLLHDQQCVLRRLATGRVSGRRLRIKIDSTGIRCNGEEFPFEAAISRVTVGGELFFSYILRELRTDTVSHHRLHSQQNEFRRRAVSSQQAHEVEKRRFSRVLYDDLGQSLSVLKLDMDWLQDRIGPAETAALPRVAQMQATLDRIICRIKSIASTLRPPLLDDFGLIAALQWVADDFQKKTGITCVLRSQCHSLQTGDPIESAVFRLVQESLLNIERHANASNVKIYVWHSAVSLDVLIQDDGIGIASGSNNKPGCYGLIAMQERIYTVGGTISITNAEARGVAIQASIPVGSSCFIPQAFYPVPSPRPSTMSSCT